MQLSPDLDTLDAQEFHEDIPPEECNIIWHLIKQLRPGMSLSRVTLPTFILEPRSTLERFSDWMSHADILRQLPHEPDPLMRCLDLCIWLISGFHIGPRGPKKPYNAVLGEVFRATLQLNDAIIGTYVAEQVSHHPPISALYYSDVTAGLSVWGHAEMRSRFYGNSVAAHMDHENTRLNLECARLGETYEFNFPDLCGRGILVGRLVAEIVGTVRIRCVQTGVTASIQFHAKPFLRGRYNCISGEVLAPGGKSPVLKFEGRWSAFMKVTDTRNGRVWIPFDVRLARPLEVVRPPIEEQGEYESEFLWRMVTRHLAGNDMGGATAHKEALEEKQRRERGFLEEQGIQWECQAFHFDATQKRWVPNALNLEDWRDGEEPIAMPPPFQIPAPIQRAYEAQITLPVAQIQGIVEANLQAR